MSLLGLMALGTTKLSDITPDPILPVYTILLLDIMQEAPIQEEKKICLSVMKVKNQTRQEKVTY